MSVIAEARPSTVTVAGFGPVSVVLESYLQSYLTTWQITATEIRLRRIPAVTFLSAAAKHNVNRKGGCN